jgi:hypothetical protein
MPFNWWLGGQNVVYPHKGILFNYREELSNDTFYNTDESQKLCWVNSQSQNITYCIIQFIWNVLNRQIHTIESRLVVARGWGKEGVACNAQRVQSFLLGWWKGSGIR